ncbi:aspartyl protease [Leptolyngbya sp. Heron Island J]|uniref:retropepsin-like aspartic protease family protein n=1 Tax=Leptolyngbya sp. Heron Island J TaxID=1385935 RepID=UPI0003B97F16|nr:retropepsin-like aspartic protease [Leptolyngbya sp. Heron Island J]ESA36621.1 aspartyl protease [Leptolyngbya sp. Heron Island J]
MLEKKRIRFIQVLCLGTLTACQAVPMSSNSQERLESRPTEVNAAVVESDAEADGAVANESAEAASEEATSALNAYQEAINLASGAFTLGQQATSPDDWDLIVGRWEQAIQKLKAVPTDDQNYAVAQTKLRDYERNLAQAKQRLTGLKQPPAEIALNRTAPIASGSQAATTLPVTSNRVPIIERRGGTPVIEVTFNGRRYPMILDTGASHTHITRSMANELGVQVVGQTSVATASSSQAVVDVGYVNAIQVGGITRDNLPVSIGDAVPIGLLGNDVYKNFDVILQANTVEFRPR